eukprot:6516869-Karenia_brevis.AAC.1
MQYLLRFGGGPLSRHSKWVAEHKISDSDANNYVHEVLSEFFELSVCYDQLDISNLACAERLAR